MKNLVRKTFTIDSSWTAPAGVKSVRIIAAKVPRDRVTRLNGDTTSGLFFLDPVGAAQAAGLNADGQLGDATVTARSSPVAVLGGLQFEKIYARILSSQSTVWALTPGGRAYAWGDNLNGQIGDSSVVPKSTPVAVSGGLSFRKLVPIAGTAVLGLTYGGAAYGWGLNTNGQLGTNDTTAKSVPTAVVGSLVFADLSARNNGSSANSSGLTTGGAAYGWGTNDKGQVGDGTTVAKSSPVPVAGGLTFKKLVASGVNTYGITTAGALYAWGDNANGQLGDGTTVAKSSPVAVLGGLTFQDVVVTGGDGGLTMSAMGLTTSGQLYAWGYNAEGQLGDGTVTHRSSPVAVLGGLTCKKIWGVYNRDVFFALTTTGALYAWGANFLTPLGTNDSADKSSPTAVAGGLTFLDLAPSMMGITGLAENGQLYSWGTGSAGGLGIGNTTQMSSPSAVIGGIMNPILDSKVSLLSVTPGTSYTITLNALMAKVGNLVVGMEYPDSITLEYFE